MTKKELASRIAQNVRRRRTSLKISLGGLADRCDVGEDYLGHIERATKIPSLEVLGKIATGLGVNLEDLVGHGTTTIPPSSINGRLQAHLRGLSEAQKEDVLALLIKLRRSERVRALRIALGA